jgi:hypothetical protein
VGIFDALTRPGRLTAIAPVMPGLESPNQSSSLAKVVYAEYFTGQVGEVSRATALSIPAFKKARDIYVGIIAGMQLREHQGDQIVDQPWLYRTESGISCWHRTAYIFDDIFFYDWSAIAVKREGEQIVDALHIPFERWDVDRDGNVKVDFIPAADREVILIPGNGSGGILTAGANTIRGALAIEKAWIGRAQNPIPLIEIHQVTDDQLDDDEIADIVDQWAAARVSPTGAVGFTDNRVELKVHGTVATDLFEQGRNAIVLDIARITGIPAAMLDGSMSTASLTYSTQEGKRNEFDDYSLPMWTDPIEARLSMDDVSAAGRVIKFDRSGRTSITAPALTQPLKD